MSSYHTSRYRDAEDGDSLPSSSSSSSSSSSHSLPPSSSSTAYTSSSASPSYLSSSARRAMTSNGFTSTSPALHSSADRRETVQWTASRQSKWTSGARAAETVQEERSEDDDDDDEDECDNPESRRGEVIGTASSSLRPPPSTLRSTANGAGDFRRSSLTTQPHLSHHPPISSLPLSSTSTSHRYSSLPPSSTSSVLFSAPAFDKVPSLLRALVLDVWQSHRARSHTAAAPPSSAHVDSLHSYCLRLLSSRLASRPSTSSSTSALSSAIDAVQREVQSSSPDDAVHAAELLQRLARRDGVREKGSILQLLLACRQQGRSSHSVGSSFSLTSTHPSFPVARLPAPSHSSSREHEPVHPRLSRERDEDVESFVERTSSTAMKKRVGVMGGGREAVESISDEQVIRDVLFTFQGVDGRLLRFDPPSLRYRLTDDAARILSAPRQRLLGLVCQLSALYRLVCGYVNGALEREQAAAEQERASRRPSRITAGSPQSQGESVKPVGLIEQSFVGALQAELSDYFRWVAVLESQWMQAPAALTLHRLLVSIQLPMARLQLLASLCSSASSSHGGALLSSLYSHFHHGLSSHRSLMTQLLRASCAPLFHFISQWIQHGQLHDPHHDFFIQADPSVPVARLWGERYRLRRSMLPSFLSPQLGQQILVIGKSVNFIRHCCNDQEWEAAAADIDFAALFPDSSSASASPTSASSSAPSSLSTSTLERDIARCAAVTNAHLLSLMSTRYNFLLHAKALKSYLLLSQGDFIQLLLSLLHSELHKPAAALNTRALVPLLDQAVRASNARFEPADVLHRLSLRLLRSTEGGGDTGWDVFSLDYLVDVPLSVVLTPSSMQVYLRLFNFLWRLKRVEWEVKEVWMRQSSHRFLIEKELRSLPAYAGLSRLLTSGYFLRQSMAHLLSNVSSYLQFEVMEVSWAVLEKEVAAAAELGDLITAHARYVQGIAEKALLVGVAASLSSLLLPLFDDILRFTRMQQQLYDEAMKEVTTRQTYTPHISQQRPTPRSTDVSRRSSLVTGQEGEARVRSVSAAEVYVHTTQALLDSGVFVQEMPRWEHELDSVTAAFHLHLHAFLAALDRCIDRGQMNAKQDGAPHAQLSSSTSSSSTPHTAEEWPDSDPSTADRSTASSTSTSASTSSSSAYIAELEFLRLRLDFNEFYLAKRSQTSLQLPLHPQPSVRGAAEATGRGGRQAAVSVDSTQKASTGLLTGGVAGASAAGSSKWTFSSTVPPARSSGWAGVSGASSNGLPPRPRSGTAGKRPETADEGRAQTAAAAHSKAAAAAAEESG